MTDRRELINNIREQPAYSIRETARYLRIPYPTLLDWVKGFPRSGKAPVLRLPDPSQRLLSFMNLVEMHVLSAIRREHGISFPKVRRALKYLEEHYPSKHPLADHSFSTGGMDLFVEKYGDLINISSEGQTTMKHVIQAYLRRVERDGQGIPIKLYPFILRKTLDEPKGIIIDPTVAFGRPVVAGTGIPTAAIFERFVAGDSISEISADYEVSLDKVEDAIRCEQESKAA